MRWDSEPENIQALLYSVLECKAAQTRVIDSAAFAMKILLFFNYMDLNICHVNQLSVCC